MSYIKRIKKILRQTEGIPGGLANYDTYLDACDAALKELVLLGSPAIADMITLLKANPLPGHRKIVLEALAKIGDSSTAAQIRELMRSPDANKDFKEQINLSLVKLDTGTNSLRTLADQIKANQVQSSTGQSLTQALVDAGDRALPFVMACLKAPAVRPETRRNLLAAVGVKKLVSAELLAYLLALAEDKNSPSPVSTLVTNLHHHLDHVPAENARILACISEYVRHRAPQVRRSAFNGLTLSLPAKLPDARVMPFVLQLLGDEATYSESLFMFKSLRKFDGVFDSIDLPALVIKLCQFYLADNPESYTMSQHYDAESMAMLPGEIGDIRAEPVLQCIAQESHNERARTAASGALQKLKQA